MYTKELKALCDNPPTKRINLMHDILPLGYVFRSVQCHSDILCIEREHGVEHYDPRLLPSIYGPCVILPFVVSVMKAGIDVGLGDEWYVEAVGWVRS